MMLKLFDFDFFLKMIATYTMLFKLCIPLKEMLQTVRVMKYILGGLNQHCQPARFVLDSKRELWVLQIHH